MALTQRQETFCLNIFSGMTQREAWGRAGYSTKYPAEDVDSHACMLFKSDKIQTRLTELRDKAESPTIMSVTKRKERLSEIANKVIKEPTTAKESILAVAELNKMDHIYTDMPAYQDNRQWNVLVADTETKEAVRRLLQGEKRCH